MYVLWFPDEAWADPAERFVGRAVSLLVGCSGMLVRAVVALTLVGAGLASCGSDGPSPSDARSVVTSSTPASSSPSPISGLDGVSGELVITRQRDLIDRGLINVLTHNDNSEQLLITDRELVADHFAGQPAATRTVNVPAGRQIAIQVPYGVVEDCTSDTPVSAVLAFAYTTPTDNTRRTTRLPIGGTDILDGIRAEQCAGRTLADETEITFSNVVMVDGTVRADLHIERTEERSEFTFGQFVGTVLVDVRRTTDSATPVTLSPLDRSVMIPLTFVVNRCDPHAMAEVTKRFGLDLELSVDGAEPHLVTIDLSPLSDDLEAAVQACVEAAE